MRKLLSLYLSYLKAGVISMVAASIVFPLYAAISTGHLSPVLGIALSLGVLAVTYLLVVRFIGPRHSLVSRRIINQSTRLEASEEAELTSNPLSEQRGSKDGVTAEGSTNLQSEETSNKPVKLLSREDREKERREEAILKDALNDINTDTADQEVVSHNLNFSIVKPPSELLPSAKIKVIGIGGGGGNAVDRMINAGVVGVEFLAVNTDVQALKYSQAHRKVQIGVKRTRGLGVGGDPNLGREAALEDTKRIVEVLKGLDMVFLTAGLGGGTGTGAIPIFARVAKELGVLTVAVVTMPFRFEGHVRQRQAEEGLMQLQDKVDTLIVVHNDKLLTTVTEETSFVESFKLADDILRQAVQGVSDIITVPGFINVDFADVKTIMSGRGIALMGTGAATGKRRSIRAIQRVINSPLLEGVSLSGARALLVNVTGGDDMTLHEVNEAMIRINEIADPEANIIFGAVVDEQLEQQIKITVIATDFRDKDTSEDTRGNSARPSEPADDEENHSFELKRKSVRK